MTDRKPPAPIASLELARARAKRKALEQVERCYHGIPRYLDCARCCGVSDEDESDGAA